MTETNEIKILLMSDLHLGIENTIPEDVRISTLKKIISLALEHDILLIAGDLIDNTSINKHLFSIISDGFTQLQQNNTKIILTPGTGELDKKGFVPSFLFNLNASYVFSNPVYESPFKFSKNGQNIFIYGIQPSETFDISKIKKESDTGFHIGLFYIPHIDSDKNNLSAFFRPLQNPEMLALDFYALGHSHEFTLLKASDKVIGAYPGSPQATSFDEIGDRYVISITMQNEEITKVKRLSVNEVEVCVERLDCSAHNNYIALKSIIEEKKSPKLFLKIELSGQRNFSINYEELNSFQDNFFTLLLEDNSTPSIDSLINEYHNEDSLRGDFFTLLKDAIDANTLPQDIDRKNLGAVLNILVKEGHEKLEDWLCDFSNA